MKPEIFLIVGGLVYLATMAMNRFLGERNNGSLSQDDKLNLTDAFSKHRSWATYLPLGIMLAIIAIGSALPESFTIVFPVGVGLLLVVSLGMQVLIFR